MTEADNVTEQRDTYSLIKPFRPRNLMTEADIGMTEHRSKNTLGRSVPIKTKKTEHRRTDLRGLSVYA